MTAASLRRIAPRARPSTVSISLNEPEAIRNLLRCGPGASKVTLAADAYPVVGFAPVVVRAPVERPSPASASGVFTITDESVRSSTRLPIDWSIYG